MSDQIKFEIENSPELLMEYGLATQALTQLDRFLGEIILLADKTMDRDNVINIMTLGPKISKLKTLQKLTSIHEQLDVLLDDRNKLAHGVIGGLAGSYSILHRNKSADLDITYLKDVTKRVKSVIPSVYQEVATFFPK